MGKVIRVAIAAIIIILVGYWAFTSIRHRQYAGSEISFKVGSGSVVINNPTQETIEARMRSGAGRIASFLVVNEELNLRQTATRLGKGRNIYYVVNLQIPPGQTEFVITRGSNVYFVSDSAQNISATVKPQGPGGGKGILIFSGLVIAGALFYISRTYDHRWLIPVQAKVPLLPRLKRAV